MNEISGSTLVYAQNQTTGPLPSASTTKELENRVKEAQLIRAETKAQANEIRISGQA